MKTIVYIDGFNLYYGIKNSGYKWLDLIKFMQIVLGKQYQIEKVNYFTSLVKARENDLQAPQRQQAYLKALRKSYSPEQLEFYYGHFLQHVKRMPEAVNPDNKINVIKTEEKGSDVNLAVHFLNDAWLDRYQCGVIVTNDSDMAEAMKLVRQKFPDKRQGLVTPSIKSEKKRVKTSKELSTHADFVRSLTHSALKRAQLPHTIPNSNISKPPAW